MPTFLHGDCLEYMRKMPDKSIDLFVCDLPYGCLTGGAGKEKAKRQAKNLNKSLMRMENGVTTGPRAETPDGLFGGCAWDIPIDLTQFWVEVKRLAKDDHTPVLMFCSTKFGYELIKSNESWFRYDLVWNKMCGVSFLTANKMPMRSHEMIYVFSKKGATYYRTDVEGDFPRWLVGKNGVRAGNHADAGMPKQNISGGEGTRCVLSVLDFKTARSNQKGEKKEHKHPTQKPDDLYAWLIERYSKEGDTVLDPTAGSFASVFTAAKMNRHAIGIEKDDTFFARAIARSQEQ